MNFQEYKVDMTKYVCPESCSCFGFAVRCSPLTMTEIPQDMLPGALIGFGFLPSQLGSSHHEFVFIYKKNSQSEIKHLAIVFTLFWLSSSGIRALILTHNNIKTIDEKFNNYKDLYRLDLSNNRINELSGTSFLEMQSLR